MRWFIVFLLINTLIFSQQIAPGKKAAKELQRAFIKAKPGAVIELAAGTYEFRRSLTLDVANVTLRGQGMDKTTLVFKKQRSGAEGLLVTKGGFVLEDLAIEDTKGDAVKMKNADGVFVRRVRVEWTRGPHEKNGSYGIYPVQCKNILVEHCLVMGASDAGIYVGQSQNIIVRHNTVKKNVAGIEIENSRHADVYKNKATGNTGGILVFDLPNLPIMGGGRIRVFENKVFSNNIANFAPQGNIVAKVPPGTGIMIMANDEVEIFKNEIVDHRTMNIGIVSYFATNKKYKDPKYDPYPEAIFVHNNTLANGGYDAGGDLGATIKLLYKKVPDIIWDGAIDQKKLVNGKLPQKLGIYLKDNGKASFANLHILSILIGKLRKDKDIKAHIGELSRLPKIEIKNIR